MAKNYDLDGKLFSFPDDVTDDEAFSFMEQQTKPATWTEAATGAVKALPKQLASSGEGVLAAGAESQANTLSGTSKRLLESDNIVEQGLGTVSAAYDVGKDFVLDKFTGTSPGKRTEQKAGFKKAAGESLAASEQLKTEADAELPANMTDNQRRFSGAVGSVARMTPTLAAAAITKNPGMTMNVANANLGLMGVETFGNTYREARKAGADPEKAMLSAAVDAAAEVGPERWSLGALLQPGANWFWKYVAREFGGEEITTLTQELNKKLGYNPSHPWEEVAQNVLVETPIQTAMMLGMAGPAGAGARTLNKKIYGEQSQFADQKGTVIPDKSPPSTTPPLQGLEAPPDMIDQLLAQAETEVIPEAEQARLRKLAVMPQANPNVPEVPETVAALKGINEGIEVDPGETDQGLTGKVKANLLNYAGEEPNTNIPRDERLITGADNEEFRGLTLKQVPLEALAGKAITIGASSQMYPAEYLEATRSTLQNWAERFGLTDTFVVTPEVMQNKDAIGQHLQLDGGIHLITPRWALKFGTERTADAYNVQTQQQTVSSLEHEFGHVLVSSKLLDGADKTTQWAILESSKEGLVDESFIQDLAPDAQEVVREFNEKKQQILSGEMSARDFVNTWAGPWKVGRTRADGTNGYLESLGLSPDKSTAMDVVEAQGGAAYALNLHEYIAEQTSRYALTHELEAGTELGSASFFKQALETLREFFQQLKLDKLVAPNVKFETWLQGLDRGLKQELVARAAETPAAVTEKVSPVDKPIEKTPEEEAAVNKAAVKVLRQVLARSGLMEDSPELFKEISALIRNGDVAEARELLQDVVDKPINWDKDRAAIAEIRELGIQLSSEAGVTLEDAMQPKVLAQAHALWKKLGPRSPFFRQWFGEWEGVVHAPQPMAASPDDLLEIRNKADLSDSATWKALHGQYLQAIVPAGLQSAMTKRDALTVAPMHFHLDTLDGIEADVQKMRDLGYQGQAFENYVSLLRVKWQETQQMRAIDPSGAAPRSMKMLHLDIALSSAHTDLANTIQPGRRNSSYVTDALGHPLVVYHQSSSLVDNFDAKFRGTSAGSADTKHGFFFSATRATASNFGTDEYAEKWNNPADAEKAKQIRKAIDMIWEKIDAGVDVETKGHLMKRMEILNAAALKVPSTFETKEKKMFSFYLDIKNPYIIDFNGMPFMDNVFERQAESAKSLGHDGMIVLNVVDGGPVDTQYIVFNETQVKAANGNNATFAHGTTKFNFDLSTEDGYGAAQISEEMQKFADKGRWMSKASRMSLAGQRWLMQLQQVAWLHPESQGLQMAHALTQDYARMKSKLQEFPDKVISGSAALFANKAGWKWLTKERDALVSKAIMAEFQEKEHWTELVKTPERGWQHQMTEKAKDELKKNGVDLATPEGQELGEIYLGAKNAMLYQLNQLERVLAEKIALRYYNNPKITTVMIQDMMGKVAAIRKRPFVPQSRFGNYLLTGYQRQDGKLVKTLVEAFESEHDRSKRYEQLHGKYAKLDIKTLTDSEVVLMALPTELANMAGTELGLSQEQVDQLHEIMQGTKTDKAFKEYDPDYLALRGASKDLMRNFSHFTWHNANMIAKLSFRSKFNLAIRALEQEAQSALEEEDLEIPERLRLFSQRQSFVQMSKEVKDYLMNPQNELQNLRMIGTLMFLWGNLKSAMLNFAGFMTSGAQLATRLGDVEAVHIIGKGSALLAKLVGGAELTPEEQLIAQYYQRGVDEGVLSQSYAYHLAGQAVSGNLARAFGRTLPGQAVQATVDTGMLPFRVVELGTRRLTFLTQLMAEIKLNKIAEANPEEQYRLMEEAYKSATQQTNLLQNDYTAGNRVKLMQGKKSVLFIFQSFMQHMAFHLSGGYEAGLRRQNKMLETPQNLHGSYTMRLLLTVLALGGYKGLPLMEDLLGLIDAWFKEHYGTTASKELRDLAREAGANPMMLERGLGHNVFGFDISHSLSFGSMVPGLNAVSGEHQSGKELVYDFVTEAMGVAGSLLNWGVKVATSDKPTALQRVQGAPGAAGNILSSVLWASQGVRGYNGERITYDNEMKQVRDLEPEEIFGKVLGFNPTIVSEARQKRYEQLDLQLYWQSQRRQLLSQNWEMTRQGDREGLADVRKAITKFNAKAPDRKLRITAEVLQNSLTTHKANQKKAERGGAGQKMFQGIYDDVSQSFEDGDK